ncbi:MAG: hypothetical protein JST80_02960 [Bdellovibrionales bacterium]|nr:hypothetical protein [Bdellovibrionales bacterium]
MKTKIREFIEQAGGPDKIRSLLFLFYDRMSKDIIIGYFFDGKDLKHIAEMQAQFILNAGNFIPKFEGKGPATAHLDLPPIYRGHFDRRLLILRDILTENNVPSTAIDAWIAFEEGFRAMTVVEERTN